MSIKLRTMFHLTDFLRTSSPGSSFLDIRTAEDFSKEVKEELGYTEFFATKTR